MTPEALTKLATIINAKGRFFQDYGYFKFEIRSVDSYLVQEAGELLGITPTVAQSHGKAQFRLRLTSDRARKLVQDIYPWLSPKHRAKVAQLLSPRI